MIASALDLLARACLDGAVAVVVVGAASFFLTRAPSLLCRLWWIACLKLLVGLAGVAPVSLPILPAASLSTALVLTPSLPASSLAAVVPVAERLSWRSIIALVYLAGVGIGCVLTLRQRARTRRVLRLAEPIRNPRSTRLLAELCAALKLRRVPKLRVSDLVSTPQVVGSIDPVVLLPRAELARLPEDELAMTLCHELVHVRRRDLLLGWVPALARRLFFFHPGAWVAAREYALAREAACDAEVIRVLGASPRRYGRLLVELSTAPSRTLAPAVAVSSSFLHLRRRLRMLEHATDPRPPSKLGWAMVALLTAAVLVPVRLAARPAEAPAPSAKSERRVTDIVPPKADRGAVDAYVFFLDASSVVMSGSMEELERARKLRGARAGELLWLRKGSKEYVVRDPAVLEPIRELHASLGEFDNGQDELGRREEELAREEERLAREQDELSAHLDALSEDRERLDEDTREGDENREEIARIHERLATEERRVERAQGEREQELQRLSAMMDALSAEEERREEEAERTSSRIEQQIREILEEALRSGKAERVRPAI